MRQVYRQIQRETKSFVDTYETVHLNVGTECMWRAIGFVSLASNLRAIFSTVVTPQLFPTATEWLHCQGVFLLSDLGLASLIDLDPDPIPEIFKSLECLVFLPVIGDSISPDSFRALFGKPDLKMVYA